MVRNIDHSIPEPSEKKEIIPEPITSAKNSTPGLPSLDFKIGSTAYRLNFGGRIQSRYDYFRYRDNVVEEEAKLYLRRVRFKSDGFVFSKNIGYKLEVDLLKMQVLDFVINWRINEHWNLAAGQWKLRGNRERVISSQKLQFVDRSLLNSKFTLDRDIGIWLMHEDRAGSVVVREILSMSEGEGKGLAQFGKGDRLAGLDYTARLEVLPFGCFTKKGDYFGADLAREAKPKLALGFTYDYNNHAIRTNGQKGTMLNYHANLSSFILDAMFKYRGFSWMTELATRRISGNQGLVDRTLPGEFENYYTGDAINTQVGYLLKYDFEIATRFTRVNPIDITDYPDLTEYTLGLSKYISGHKFKVQSDISLLKEAEQPDAFRFRLQLELSI